MNSAARSFAAAMLMLWVAWAAASRMSAQATPDYETAITAYRNGQIAEAMRRLIDPRVTLDDHPQRAVRRAQEAVHARERGALELTPRLRAMAGAHTEAYLLHDQYRDTIPARWHHRAAMDALDALDWMGRVDPRVIADGFRQIVHDTHAHQLAVLGDHARLIEFGGELRRTGQWSDDTALATGTSFERRAHDVPAWSVAPGRASFEHWRLDHLRSAERSVEEAHHLVAYGDALTVGYGPSACAGLQYHAVIGATAPTCPQVSAVAPDPWSDYLSGDVERLDVLTLRLREVSRP